MTSDITACRRVCAHRVAVAGRHHAVKAVVGGSYSTFRSALGTTTAPIMRVGDALDDGKSLIYNTI
jgi:hypothetical protein